MPAFVSGLALSFVQGMPPVPVLPLSSGVVTAPGYRMSKHNPSHRPRRRALAIATGLAIAACLPLAAGATERVNLSGLQSAETHDRFIVKYRDGSAAQADPACAERRRQRQAAAP